MWVQEVEKCDCDKRKRGSCKLEQNATEKCQARPQKRTLKILCLKEDLKRDCGGYQVPI